MSMKLILFVAGVALAALFLRTFVRDDLSPLQRGVAQELKTLGIRDVDVTTLEPKFVSELSMAMSTGDSNEQTRDTVRAILRRAGVE